MAYSSDSCDSYDDIYQSPHFFREKYTNYNGSTQPHNKTSSGSSSDNICSKV